MRHRHRSAPRGAWIRNQSTVAVSMAEVLGTVGGAVEIVIPQVPGPPEEPTWSIQGLPPEDDGLEAMTIRELKALAAERGIKLGFARSKEAIRSVLREN